jgi:hypothetical protein
MELISIVLARVIGILELEALDPFGKASSLDAILGIGGRLSFHKMPQRFSEIDFQKGVELEAGKLDDINIDKLTLYPNGIVIDTKSSTDDAEMVLVKLLDLAKELFGAQIVPSRKNIVSQIMFRSKMNMAKLNPVLQRIAESLAPEASHNLKHQFAYEPTNIFLAPDLSQVKTSPAVFSIERRVEVPFGEDTYFSTAPVRTAHHLKLIEQFEAALI